MLPKLVAQLKLLVALSKLFVLVTVSSGRTSRQMANLVELLSQSVRHGFTPALSFSEMGEDILISELEARQGFYVDIGAHHPFRFSVTARLAAAGWTGACFDVTAAVPEDFRRARPSALSARQLIGSPGVVEFFGFEEGLVSTADKSALGMLESQGFGRPLAERLQKRPLHEALERLGVEPRVINFCNIDVEGGDLDVVASHDFGRYPIEVMLVEILPVDHSGSIFEPFNGAAVRRAIAELTRLGYSLARFHHRSGLFVHSSFRP